MADANALWQQGQSAIRARRLDQARASFESLLRIQPAHVPARLLLASVHLAGGTVRAAAQHTLAAAQSLPPDVGVICRVAQALCALGETNAARAALAHPAIAASRDARALRALAHQHQGLGEQERALPLMDRALALGLDTPDLRYFRALQLQFHGRLEEAQAELERCLRMGPTYGRASLTLARLRKATPERNQLAFIAQRLAQVPQGSEDEAAFEFARYAELEALGRDEEAWTALARGNALMHARLRETARPDEAALIDAIRTKATPAFLAETAPAGPPASPEHPQPIFVVGMPRSGTTLLESILGAHSQVSAAGELNDFPKQWRFVADVHGHALVDERLLAAETDFAELGRRYLEQTRWRARGRAYYVDKLPPNFWLAGFIHKALPQAKVLHMARAPMELCFSNWRALFGDSYAYSYEHAALAAHHAGYRRLMAHWHAAMPGVVHDVDYAALVAEPEREARALLAHCGLAFEPGCLEARRAAGPVATLSSAQVRAPIRADASRDWQRYATQIEPWRRALGG
jgi:tetratricopeptide (TPR) repeat protein